MWLGVFLLILSAAQVYLASELGGVSWFLGWPALSAWWLGLAYLAHAPRMVGKQRDGSIAPWAWVLLLPYLVFANVVWRMQKRLGGEDAWNEVVPGLFLGRRVLPGELPPGIQVVVDLTAEFPEPRAVRTAGRYRCLATLDADAPQASAFVALVAELAACQERIFVHCASGHGRSATVVAAVLIRRGLARNVHGAEVLMRTARPSVDLKPVQKALVERVHARLTG